MMKDLFQLAISLPGTGFVIAVFIPFISLLPMFGEGLANAADAPFHAHRIYALSELIQAGNLYPRWVPYFHLGYGYPVFNFYAPGATHLAAWLHLAGFDVLTAYHLTVALSWVIGSVGMFLLARCFLPAKVALLACVLWVYAPSRFYEFWWQGSLAQIVATSFTPFLFYGLYRTRLVPCLRNSLLIAIPLSLIVLSHTPTTYIVAVFVLPGCLVACLPAESRSKALRRLLFIGIGIAIAAGLSAIFLLPALAELEYVRIGSELPDTVAFLTQQFLSPAELVSWSQLIDVSDATLLMPRSLGLIGSVLCGLGVIALLIRRRFSLALLLLAGLALAIFLMLEPSLDFWLTIPGFRKLRFPERILRMAALFVALLGAFSVMLIPHRWRPAGVFVVSALVIWQALPLMHPRDDDRVWDGITARDEIEMEFREYNWGTTAYNEYLPVWGNGIPFDFPRNAEAYVDNPSQINVHAPDFSGRSGRVSYRYLDDNLVWIKVTGDRKRLRFRQFYFPGWQVMRDGAPVPFEADEEFGLIQVRLPDGEHLIQLDYVGTAIQHVAALISLICIAVCVFIGWRGNAPARAADAPSLPFSRNRALSIVVGLTAFAFFNSAWLQDKVFRVKSDLNSPAYMDSRLDVTFDESITLLGYTLESDDVDELNPLGIRLYWRLAGEPALEYRPVVQLVNLGVDEAWAVSQPANFEGGKITKLSQNQFLSDGHRLKLFADVPAFVGRVSVQLTREDETASFATLADGSDRVLLPEIIPIHTRQQSFAGQSKRFSFGDMLTLHCIESRLSADRFAATLWWEVEQHPSQDLHLFLHGMTEDETLLRQNDHAPLPGYYPTSYWREGQHLQSDISLDLSASVTQVYIGMYDPGNGLRLPISVDDLVSDRIALPLEDSSCRS